MRAKIIEMDAERRRLSLSLKRVDDDGAVRAGVDGATLGLSEEVFSEPAPEGPDLSPEDADASIEADAVAPEEQGPGDSDGTYPASPDEDG